MFEEAIANLSRFVAENSAKAETTAADTLEDGGKKVEVKTSAQEEKEAAAQQPAEKPEEAKEKKTFGASVPSKPIGFKSLMSKVPKKGVGLMIFIALVVVFAIKPANGQNGISHLSLIGKAFLGSAKLGDQGGSSGSAPITHKQSGGVSSYKVGNNPFLNGWIQDGGTQA